MPGDRCIPGLPARQIHTRPSAPRRNRARTLVDMLTLFGREVQWQEARAPVAVVAGRPSTPIGGGRDPWIHEHVAKVFIDRCTPLCNAKTGETSVPPGKVGVAVALRAGPSVAENQHIIDTIAHFFGHLGIELVETYTLEGVEHPADLEGKELKIQEAYELGLQVSSACAA